MRNIDWFRDTTFTLEDTLPDEMWCHAWDNETPLSMWPDLGSDICFSLFRSRSWLT